MNLERPQGQRDLELEPTRPHEGAEVGETIKKGGNSCLFARQTRLGRIPTLFPLSGKYQESIRKVSSFLRVTCSPFLLLFIIDSPGAFLTGAL